MWLYIVSFLSQAITAISVDSFRAITKDILDKNEMSKGISISQTGRGLSYILGDLLAGAFLIFFQRTFFVFFIIMAILSIIMLYNTLKDVKPAPKHKKTKYQDAFPYILAVLPVMVLSFILAGSSSALDVYSAYIISTYLKSGILWYTLFIVAFPFGSIIAGFYIASHRKNISRFFVLLMLPFAFLLLFISAYAFEIVIAAVLLGIISAFINIKITSYITINTPGGNDWQGECTLLYNDSI